MKKNTQNKKAFSVIMSLMIIWFLLVVTTWVYKLVLFELTDNRWVANYLKAYAAAEWVWELALLEIKEKWYAYDDKIDNSINNKSIILAKNSLNIWEFNKVKDAYVSFDFNYIVDNFNWAIDVAWYDILPLFYIDDLWEKKSKNLTLSVSSGNASSLAWNIVWETSWISWVWNFSSSTIWKWRNWAWIYFEQSVWSFLNNSDSNYLILFNTDSLDPIDYNLKSENTGEFFTKPRTDIITSAVIGKYRQNLKIHLDNTQYLWLLKYSIYWK